MEEGAEKERRVCVTGAGGYVASWLVKLLLSRGFHVHGTVRDPSDEKYAHLKKLKNASEKLQLFNADLLNYDSMAAAIAECEGVFHVASPVPSTKVPNPEVEVVSPAITGTLNVLKACLEAKVKQVIAVSSTSAVFMNPSWPKEKPMDENCWSDKEYCRTTENWYYYSKTVAEAEALKFAEEHGLDIVTVCPSIVIGPLLQTTVNASSLFLCNIVTGRRESIENRFYHIVDVRDVANVLLLLYEKPEASGRYICTSHRIKSRELVEMLKSMYPDYKYTSKFTEATSEYELVAEKLKKLGWKSRPLQETLADSMECYKGAGLLED